MKPPKPDPESLLALDEACDELNIKRFMFVYYVLNGWVRLFRDPKLNKSVRYQIQESAPVIVKENVMPSQTAPETPKEQEAVQGIIFYPEEDELPGQYRQPSGTRSPGRYPRRTKAATRPR